MSFQVGNTVFSSIVSAITFSGGSYLFSKLDHPNYLKETCRHNKVLEELTKGWNKFYKEEVARKDKIAKLRQELAEANNDEIATNKALIQLEKYKQSIHPEPKLSDYYTPSDEAKHYQTTVIAALWITWWYWCCRNCKPTTIIKCLTYDTEEPTNLHLKEYGGAVRVKMIIVKTIQHFAPTTPVQKKVVGLAILLRFQVRKSLVSSIIFKH